MEDGDYGNIIFVSLRSSMDGYENRLSIRYF
jgi:hypothetical protein